MGWARRVGLSLVIASLAVAGSVAANQLLTGNERLSWTALYFVLVFTVPGALLTQLPARSEGKAGKPSRRRYLRRMRASVEQMETIGLVTQAEYVLRTRQVYVDVALQPRPVTETMPDGGVGGSASRSAGPAGSIGVRKPLASFLAQGKVLAVLGAAGSGKTTLVRYTALTMAEQRWWPWQADFWRPRRMPVLFYLRDHAQAILADPQQNLAVIASAAPWLEGAVSAPWLQRRLDQRRCVVLLDGLDEVADARERATVVAWVNTQVNRYPGNTIVVTSRPLGYDSNRVAQADVLQVQRFTHAQITEFLGAWFHAIEHRARQGADSGEIDRIAYRGADDLIRRITALPALLDLAANPLLLTMIANVHRYRGRLPGRRADLYAEMCQVLLHRRQEAKNLPALHPALDDLDGDAKERPMRRLAWQMMLQHQRDIPIADAEAALGDVSRPDQPGPPLTAHAFLDYARRSGLLLEHRHGHYGFAHLSLQEYLAATHVPGHDSRRQVLVGQVNDPWWRETTLLWSARNDASLVVEECLATRTVPALSLAYACADQAAELDQKLRDRLTALLSKAPVDADEERLLNGVAADRELRDFIQLDDGTAICATPVSKDLWNRYLRHLEGGAPPNSPSAPPIVPEPIRGLPAAALPGFLNWLNGLFDEGAAYRFPTLAEFAQLPVWTGNGTTWAYDNVSEYRLYQPDGTAHPHVPTPAQLDAYPGLIIDRTSLPLHLAANVKIGLSRFLVYGFFATRQSAARHPEYQLVHVFDLLATIEAAHALALNRDLAPVHARTLDRTIDRARDLARALHRSLARDLDQILVRGPDLAAALASAHVLVLNFVRASVTSVTRDSDLELALYRALALLRVRDLARDTGLEHALDNDLDRDRVIALDLALSGDPDLAGERDHRLNSFSRDLNLDLGRALDLARSRHRDRALIHTPEGIPQRNHDRYLRQALTLSRDMAVARLLQWDRKRREVTEAGIGLLEAWAVRSDFAGEAMPGLRAFVSGVVAECAQVQPQDDPPAALTSVIEAMSAQAAYSRVCELLGQARELITPPRDGSRPADRGNLVLAGALLLAAILALTSPPHQEEADAAHAVLLQGVLTTLIARTDSEQQNQTVLLARV